MGERRGSTGRWYAIEKIASDAEGGTGFPRGEVSDHLLLLCDAYAGHTTKEVSGTLIHAEVERLKKEDITV